MNAAELHSLARSPWSLDYYALTYDGRPLGAPPMGAYGVDWADVANALAEWTDAQCGQIRVRCAGTDAELVSRAGARVVLDLPEAIAFANEIRRVLARA